MHEISQFFVEVITRAVQDYGYLAVFLLMTAESALIPIPSEVTMPFAGFMASLGYMNFWVAVTIGAFGNLVGSWIAYYVGYKKGESWLRTVIKKWGKFLLIKETEFDKSMLWFAKHGQIVAFTSRLLPVVRTFISLPAGIAKMEIYKFSLLTFLGSFLWTAFLTYLGLILGDNWHSIEPYFREFQYLIIGLFIAAAIFYIYHHLKPEKAKKA
jgi:membrane protein DedA with SNARE-associated domain